MKITYLIYSVLALITTSLFAQNTAKKNKEPSTEVSLYAFERNNHHKTIYLKSPKNKPYEIPLSKANILGPFKTVTDDDGRVTLRKKETNAEGDIIYPVLAKVEIPAKIKEPLIILVPIAGKHAYKTFIVDRSLEGFPKGSYKLINFSSSMIRGFVGETKVNVKPRNLFSFNPSSNVQDIMDVHFQYKLDEKWKTFGRTRWIKVQEKRSLLCVFQDSKTKRMRIRGVNMESIQPLRDRKKPKMVIGKAVED